MSASRGFPEVLLRSLDEESVFLHADRFIVETSESVM